MYTYTVAYDTFVLYWLLGTILYLDLYCTVLYCTGYCTWLCTVLYLDLYCTGYCTVLYWVLYRVLGTVQSTVVGTVLGTHLSLSLLPKRTCLMSPFLRGPRQMTASSAPGSMNPMDMTPKVSETYTGDHPLPLI